MKLRIVSNGTALGTRFYDDETGQPIELVGCTRVEIDIDANSDPKPVRLSFFPCVLDIVADRIETRAQYQSENPGETIAESLREEARKKTPARSESAG